MIGVFDSGIGGLSVLAAIARELPGADLVYYADSAHLPYGSKDNAFIRGRVLGIGHALVERGCTMLVVACNTATAAAIESLRASLPGVPVVGVEPGVKPAANSTQSGRIVVLATPSTARSERLARLVRAHAAAATIDLLPCPGWATRVETLQPADADFERSARLLLAPALAAGADRVVLGCTHYTFLAPLLEAIVAGRALLVDVADAVARQCQRVAGEEATRRPAAGGAHLTLLASARPERLQAALPALGLGALSARQTAPAGLLAVER